MVRDVQCGLEDKLWDRQKNVQYRIYSTSQDRSYTILAQKYVKKVILYEVWFTVV